MSGERDDLLSVIERLDQVLARPGELAASGPLEPDERRALPNDLVARFRRLCEASALLSSPPRGEAGYDNLDPVLATVVDIAVELASARRGLLFLKQEDGSLEMRIARDARHGPGGEAREISPFPRDYPRTIVDRVFETGEPVFVATMTDDEPLRSQSVRALGLVSVLCVPLALGALPGPRGGQAASAGERRRFPARPRDRVLGAIYVDSNAAARRFREEDLYLVRLLANHATTALAKERLYRQAITDPLTRLLSRASLERELDEAASRLDETRAPFALLLLDPDGLEGLDARLGRLAGDSILRDLAAVVRKGVRSGDLAFRHGSGALAVLLPETDEAGALVIAEKLRAQIESSAFFGGEARLTVSIGLAASPAHATGRAELARKADQALARAKESGNRAVAWSAELGPLARRADALSGILAGDFASDHGRVALLLETLERIGERTELREVCQVAVDAAIEATGAERGALLLADEAGHLSTAVARGRDRRPLELAERFSRSVPERVHRSGEPLHVLAADEGAPSDHDSVAELGIATVLCAPLVVSTSREDGPARIGVLYVDSRRGADSLGEAALPFLTALARHVSPAIRRAHAKTIRQ